MIKQGTKISCGCCKFFHSLISEGYVEFMTFCLIFYKMYISQFITPRFSLYFGMSCPGIHFVEMIQVLVITFLDGSICSLSALMVFFFGFFFCNLIKL